MGDETASRWARELLSAYFTALHRDEEFATSSWNADTSHDTYAHATDPEAVNDEQQDFLPPLEYVAGRLSEDGVRANEAIKIVQAAAVELGTALDAPKAERTRSEFIRTNAGCAPVTLPSSTPTPYHRLALKKLPSTIRKRFPSFTQSLGLKRLPPSDPSCGDSPRRLVVLARAHDAWLPRVGTQHDEEAFEEELRYRREKVDQVSGPNGPFPRPSWGRTGPRDACRGPLLDGSGSLRTDLFTGDISKLDILVWLTFPVNPPGGSMIEHPTSTAADFKLCSTAKKLVSLQSLMPKAASRMLWLDSVPAPRAAGERSRADDEAQFEAFLATCRLVRTLDVRVIILLQITNRTWFESALLPSHVDASLPDLDEDAFYCEGEDLDKYWFWQHLEKDDTQLVKRRELRPISELERSIYVHHNVLQGCESNRCIESPSVFVRRLFGNHNCRIFFGPHLCTLDPLAYPSEIFLSSCDSLERIALAVETLATSDRTSTEKGTLRRMHEIPALRGVLIKSKAAGGSTLAALRQLRTYEYASRKPMELWELGTALVELLEKWLLDEPGSSLADYEPCAHPTFPSLIGDLISRMASVSLATLARIEGELRGGLLGTDSSEARLFREAAASPHWQERLQRLGISPSDRSAFRTAYAQNPIKRPSPGQSTRQGAALRKANPNARLYWSCHFIYAKDDYEALARGRISTLASGRSAPLRFSGGIDLSATAPPCTKCANLGLPSCVMDYDVAVLEGYILNFVPPEEVAEAVQSWYDIAVQDEFKVDRAEFLEQNEHCMLEVEEWV